MESVEENLDLFKKITTFVINKKSDELKTELYEFFVMFAVYEDRSGKTKQEIIELIRKELKVEQIPIHPVEVAIKNMIERNSIYRVKKGDTIVYILSEDERNKIGIIGNEYNNIITNINTILKKKLLEFEPEMREKDLLNYIELFNNFLSYFFSKSSLETCSNIVRSRDIKIPFKITFILHAMDQELRNIPYKRTRDEIKNIFVNYLSNPDEYLEEYLFLLAQSYFIIHIIRLDPECENYTKSRLRERLVYLDTNIIFAALVTKHNKHKAAVTSIKLMKDLGINVTYSEQTKNEYLNLIENKRRDLSISSKIPTSRYEKIKNFLENGIVKDLLEKKKTKPSIEYDGYFNRLEAFEAIIKNRYNIELDPDNHPEILEIEGFEILSKIVTQEGMSFSLFKTENVANHDARVT